MLPMPTSSSDSVRIDYWHRCLAGTVGCGRITASCLIPVVSGRYQGAAVQQPVSEIGFIPLIPPHFLLIVVVLTIISLRDLHVRGHIHPVNLAGGGALLAIQGLQYWWMGSPLWQSLVDGLPGLISRSPVSSKGSWWKFL